MAETDWLGSYRHIASVHVTLDRMSRRLRRENRLVGAGAELEENYASLEADFRAFFPDVVRFARAFIPAQPRCGERGLGVRIRNGGARGLAGELRELTELGAPALGDLACQVGAEVAEIQEWRRGSELLAHEQHRHVG